MQDSILFNVGLLLEESFQRKLIEYSQTLLRIQPALYSLGEGSLPHVTLLQFHGKVEDSERIWEKLQPFQQIDLKLDFLGLYLERFNHWNVFWVRVRRSRELEHLQAQVLKLLQRDSVINGVGDRFDPHATLLAWPESPWIPAFPIATDVIHQPQIRARLTLGKSGPNYQYAECLYG